MKKLCALVLLLGGLAVAPGCTEKCGGESKPYFDVRGMQGRNIFRPDTAFAQSTNYYPIADSAGPVAAASYGIELQAAITFYASAEHQAGGLGRVIACDPVALGYSGSQEFIQSITITSNAEFDAAHPAGTSLNEYFDVSAIGNQYLGPSDSLSLSAIPLNHFLGQNSRARQNLQLWLTQRPETALTHQFTVVYRQTNGEEYTVTAPPVTFQ